MDINKWMDNSIPTVAGKLEESINFGYHLETSDQLGFSGRKEIYEIVEDLLGVLFPGRYSHESIEPNDLTYYLNHMLRHICYRFEKHLRKVFYYRCTDNRTDCDCDDRAARCLVHLVEALPRIRETLILDLKASLQGDPAAASLDEIVLSYPSVEAIATHRIAHILYNLKVPVIPRIMSEYSHSRTGIDIHPGAEIEEGFFIDHGTGVVIGETCKIGKNVKVYQGVTLGALSPFDKEGHPRKGEKRHPNIEDNVIIYANATILGGNTTIGKGSIIGGNTWITASVPPQSLVYTGQKSQVTQRPDETKAAADR